MVVITPLVAYFSLILTELRRKRRNYSRKKFYNFGHLTNGNIKNLILKSHTYATKL
jgi:hypothetical protein